MPNLIQKWLNQSKQQKKLLLEAYFYLFYTRLLLLFPFKRVVKLFKLQKKSIQQEPPAVISNNSEIIVGAISRAIITASKYTPFKALCLNQALTAHLMLNKRQISALLFLGVGKDREDQHKLVAHAWVKCNNKVITGNQELEKYAVVAVYSW